MSQFTNNLEVLIRARYPILYIQTHEEGRICNTLCSVAKKLDKKIFEWSITQGFSQTFPSRSESSSKVPRSKDPLEALCQVSDQIDPAIFVLHDFHPFLSSGQHSIIRKLKEIARFLKNSYRTVIIISPIVELPIELEKEITVLEFPLPGRDEISQLLIDIEYQLDNSDGISLQLDPTSREFLVEAALGLTLQEAENVFAKIIVKNRQLVADDVESIIEEKQQLVRKSGLLEFYPATESLDAIGGLGSLKAWLEQRSLALSQKAKSFGLRPPKGVLLLGVQGCGKSLCAKAVAHAWKLPLLRFDVGRMFGSYIGASEANIRKAIDLAESIAPAILWVDEIDKAFSGLSDSGGSDSGTTARVLATFLTWLSEKTSPVFVVATANSITKLPPELLRKGRLDEIFFVDLPSENDLHEIIKIHLEKRDRDPNDFQIEHLSRLAKDFSGAEIEEAVNSALYEAFHTQTPLATRHIENAIAQTVPLAQTMDDQIKQLRSWAHGRARMAAKPANT